MATPVKASTRPSPRPTPRPTAKPTPRPSPRVESGWKPSAVPKLKLPSKDRYRLIMAAGETFEQLEFASISAIRAWVMSEEGPFRWPTDPAPPTWDEYCEEVRAVPEDQFINWFLTKYEPGQAIFLIGDLTDQVRYR